LNKHRADFEHWASDLLQVPIQIGAVHADWRGNIPELTLTQVVTLDKVTHRPAFEMREIKFGFQLFTSLWKRKIVLEDIIISGAEVTVVQDASGTFTIKDLPVENDLHSQAYQLSNILGWIFAQPYLSLRDMEVHVVSATGEKHPFALQKMSVINHGNEHRIKGNVSLQQEVPTDMQVRIEWWGQISDPEHIKAKAYLDLEGVSLGQWLQGKNSPSTLFFPGWQVHQGVGGLSLWLTWENQQLQEAQSVFQWYDLEFYSVADKKTYPIDHLSGHVGWKREGEGQVLAGDNILINFPNHLWPATTFYVALVPAPVANETPATHPNASIANVDQTTTAFLRIAEEGVKNSLTGTRAFRLQELRLGYLDVQDLLPIVLANASLPAEWRKNLVDLAPQGELRHLALIWRGELSDVTQLTGSGEVKDLSFNPWNKFPGLANLDGDFRWEETQGRLELASEQLAFALPALFPEPLLFEKAEAGLALQYNAEDGWSLKSKGALLKTTDASVKADLQLAVPPQQAATIDLDADFSLSKVTQLAHYLPARIMDPALVTWLKEAFLKGHVDAGKAVIQGRLDLFPFEKTEMKKGQKGRFEVSGELRDLDFHYAPHWPLLQQAQGHLNFSGRAMTVVIDEADLLDIPLKQVTGGIPYLGKARPQVVHLQAKVETDLSDGLEFIHQSPLEESIGKDLASLQMKGPLNLLLSLSIPLAHPEKTKVLGQAQFKQGILDLPEWSLTLNQVTGSFQFTERELSAPLLQAKLWGEPARLRLSTVVPQGLPSYVQAELSGRVSAVNLQDAMKVSLTSFLSGATAFQAKLKLYQSSATQNEIDLTSKLQGMAVDLPAPFGKPAAVQRDFHLNWMMQPGPGLQSQLSYGNVVQAQFTVTRQQNTRVIDIDSSQVKGHVRVAYPFNVKAPIVAQLERLVVQPGNAENIAALDPRALPPLDISSQQFIYGNKNLGQMNLLTTPKNNGLAIQKFSLSTPDYQFKSKGQWTGSGKTQQSQLQGTIESSRVNQFLNRLGLSLRSLLVNKGRASFDLQWRGAPYSLSLATLSGDFSFALEKGRIINLNEADNTKMDMGRMLSLFSLQTIPRRLSLDFSDLFEKGYSFDFMRGDFSLKQGSAFTQKPAVFEGPVAHVAAAGRIGLLAQDYDLNLSISPYVTDSLPVVAGALTLNPLVGAAAWLVNKAVLSREVSKVATYNYKVTGPWNAPVWRSVSNQKA